MRIYLNLPKPRVNGYACYPDSFGHYYDEPNHWENRSADICPVWNLHVITKGKGYVIQGDRKTALGAGTGFLYYPICPSATKQIRKTHGNFGGCTLKERA